MKKLVKGSRIDELPNDQIDGTWRRARNITNYKKLGASSNEDGTDNITPNNFPSKPVIGIIPINKSSVYFFSPSNTGNDSEIGIIDDNNIYTPKIKDVARKVVLNFDINFPIQGTYEYKFNKNLIVGWTDNNTNPKILNLDCLPFLLDNDFTVTSSDVNKAKALIKLFPDALTPIISDINVSDNGGNLKTGVVYPIISYELKDKSTTSWLKVYNPIPIVQDSTTLAFNQYDGDASGLPTSRKLSITLSNIDTNYLNIRFGVIILQNGVYTPYYVSSFKINGTSLTFDFTGSENTILAITLDEVLIPNAIYDKVNSITNLLGKLYIGGVQRKQQIKYQKWANLITVKWVQGNDITLIDNINTSYKNSKIVFFDKEFRSNEVYALYIAFKYKTGTYSDGFHIPGREMITGEDTVLSNTGNTDIDFLDPIDLDVKNFQVSETALIDGTMGFWMNNSESYPNIDDFDSTIDYNGNPISGGIDLRNKFVRHHKFPEIELFLKNSQNYFNKITSLSGSALLEQNFDLDEYTSYLLSYGVISNTTVLTFSSGADYSIITSPVDKTLIKLEITIDYSFFLEAPDPYVIIIFQFLDLPSEDYTINSPPDSQSTTVTFTKYYYLPIANTSALNFRINARSGSRDDILNHFVHSSITITSFTLDVKSKPLGIIIDNINIPDEILDQIDGYEIFYAKRNSSNIRMIGQDVMLQERFHTFDLIHNQANLRGSYLKPQIQYTVQDPNLLLAGIETDGNALTSQNGLAIKAIESFLYLGENVLVPINNNNKATNLYLKHQGESVTAFQAASIGMFWDICIYRKDIYKSFDTQELVSTGYYFKVITSGIQSSQNVFGGDTFISAFGFVENISSPTKYLIPQESAANIGLRMDDETIVPSKYYYPKHISSPNPTISYYGYNDDYTALNILNKVFPHAINYDNCNNDIYLFEELIAFSITDLNENLILNWRIFKINDYYDNLPKDKGKLVNILGNNRTLYIQLEYALLIAEIKDKIQGTDIYLATTNLFDRPPVEIAPTKEGYVGGQSKYAIILCKLGYVTIDREQGKIFLYNPQNKDSLKEISAEGYYVFFLNNLQNTNPIIDNPFNGNGFTCTFDLQFNRLIIVKKDSENQFTMSYCGDTNSWLCNHDYFPNFIYTVRSGMYGIDNIHKKLYKHNSDTLKGIFYEGVMYNSYVEVVFNESNDISKVFSSANWITEVIDLVGASRKEETLTGLMVYNSTQCSGIINLQGENGLWFGKDVKNKEQTWNFNKFRDLVKDTTLPFLDEDGNLINTNININKSWFDKSKFISKFVIVRLIYNNVNQRDLHILSVDSNIRKSDR